MNSRSPHQTRWQSFRRSPGRDDVRGSDATLAPVEPARDHLAAQRYRFLIEGYLDDIVAVAKQFAEIEMITDRPPSDTLSNGAQTGPPIGVEEGPLFDIVETVVGDTPRWVRWRPGVARQEAHPAGRF